MTGNEKKALNTKLNPSGKVYLLTQARIEELYSYEELLLSLFEDLFESYIMMVAFSSYHIRWNDKTGWEEINNEGVRFIE